MNTFLENNDATICMDNTCVTVRGNTAKIVNGIVIAVVVFAVLALLDKTLR